MAYKPQIGTLVQDLDTPALLIDLDALERNIQKMAAFFCTQSSRAAAAHQNPQMSPDRPAPA